ncbi:MAG TPA: hypothetical protein VG474_03575 [Solirubrobacteraceae bacterium]|nr:hypothetical protein [Solirubrobacteraceae bacterium]
MISGVLVLVAFFLACAGIVLVGRAAWPLYRGEPQAGGEEAVASTSSQLTRGLVLTFVSIAALALATAASWWPEEEGGDGGGQVRVQTNDGRTACGELAPSPRSGALRIVADSQAVDVALGSLASVVPASGC